jgi:excisionase family DNA binding protein
MTSEFEVAFRKVLKSVIREVADEVLRERQSTESVIQSKPPDQADALLLRASEAAKRLAISPRHLHNITQAGLLPCVRIGRLVHYSVETIEQWIRDSESTDRPAPRSKVVANRPKTKAEKSARSVKVKAEDTSETDASHAINVQRNRDTDKGVGYGSSTE